MKNTSYRPAGKKTVSWSTHPSFLEQVRAGNQQAWHEFYRKYGAMIHTLGRKHHLSPEECDDLLVDVMVIFWKKVDEFVYTPERGKFRSYLGQIAHYAALRIRTRRRRERIADAAAAPQLEYPDGVDAAYMAEWRDFLLEKALEELQNSVDTDTYEVFYMSVFQHRSVQEISTITRKTPNNIYVIRSRCLKKLRAIITALRQCGEAELAALKRPE